MGEAEVWQASSPCHWLMPACYTPIETTHNWAGYLLMEAVPVKDKFQNIQHAAAFRAIRLMYINSGAGIEIRKCLKKPP